MGCLMTSSGRCYVYLQFWPMGIEFRPKFFFDFSHLLIFFYKVKHKVKPVLMGF